MNPPFTPKTSLNLQRIMFDLLNGSALKFYILNTYSKRCISKKLNIVYKFFFFCHLIPKSKLSYMLDSLHTKGNYSRGFYFILVATTYSSKNKISSFSIWTKAHQVRSTNYTVIIKKIYIQTSTPQMFKTNLHPWLTVYHSYNYKVYTNPYLILLFFR